MSIFYSYDITVMDLDYEAQKLTPCNYALFEAHVHCKTSDRKICKHKVLHEAVLSDTGSILAYSSTAISYAVGSGSYESPVICGLRKTRYRTAYT